MRALQILIVVFFYFSNFLTGLSQDYVPLDSGIFQISEKQCNSFTTRAARKCDKLAAKVRKTTDASLAKFQKVEDKILNSICGIYESHTESYLSNRCNNKKYPKPDQPCSNYL